MSLTWFHIDLESVRKDKSHSNPNYDGFTGLKQLGVRSLNYKLVFLANNVQLSHVEVCLQIRKEMCDKLSI